MTISLNRHSCVLDADWDHLRSQPAAIDAATLWALTAERPTNLDDVLTAVGFRTDSTSATEDRLRRLVLMASKDQLATRVVLQRILPGLKAVARRRRDDHNPLDELITAAWIAICTYNPNRNPSSIARALIDDAYSEVYRRGRSRVYRVDPVDTLETVAAPVTTKSGFEELTELACDAFDLGMISNEDLTLLKTILHHNRLIDVANELSVTTRTIRTRKTRLVENLRQAA